MSRATDLFEEVNKARRYTTELLASVPESEWLRMPHEAVTHVAWQVGHLAMAEYTLCLLRLRGARPDDENLISKSFLEPFRAGSTPIPDPRAYPSPAEIRSVFDAVHRRTQQEISTMDDAVLDEPPEKPHKLFNRKGDSLIWCAHHEMLHAGQIGLLRRLLGFAPLW